MLVDMTKLWMCDFLLFFIYPSYYYVFTRLEHDAQMAFTLLLPVIKLFMRNLFARAVGHLGDETPTLVIFNADVFGSLFTAYCMQSSPSFWTTMELMAIDVCLIGISLRDIEKARRGLDELERKIDWSNTFHDTGGHVSASGKSTALERARILLEREPQLQVDDTHSFQLLELEVKQSDDEEREREGPRLAAKITKKMWNIRVRLTPQALVFTRLMDPNVALKRAMRVWAWMQLE